MGAAAQRWLLFAGFAAFRGSDGVTVVQGQLPADTSLELTLERGGTVSAAGGGTLRLGAGEAIKAITIKLPSNNVFNVQGSRLKIVQGNLTSAAAAAGACYPGSSFHVGPETVNSPLYLATGWQAQDAPGVQSLTTVPFNNRVAFRRGGTFRVCYSSDGTFRGSAVGSSMNLFADTPNVNISVHGVTTTCLGADCLSKRHFPCYARFGERGALNACGITIDGATGSLGRASWSLTYNVTYGGDGMPLFIDEPSCGVFPDAVSFCPGPTTPQQQSCPASITNHSVNAASATEFLMPPTLPFQYVNETRTVAVCYCSGIHGCNQYGEYLQQLGMMLIFTASLRPPTQITCQATQWGTLSEMVFIICVICPPLGCPFGSNGSRLRLVENLLGVPEYPAWSANHRCHTAPTSRHLVPRRSAASYNWSSTDVMDFEVNDGGHRSDYKRFQPVGAAGFALPTWQTFKNPGTEADVCFCLDNCHIRTSWFKVGQFDIFATFLTSLAAVVGNTSMVVPFEVMVPGQIVLDASLEPYRNVQIYGLDPGGYVKIAEFNSSTHSNITEACTEDKLMAVSGLTYPNRSAYAGTVRDQRLVFDGNVSGTTLTFRQSGTAAVCYCPIPSSTAALGCGSGSWMGIGLLVIAGPRINQYWELPTFHVTRMEYYGTDLRPTDRLVFVASDATCSPTTPRIDMCPPYSAGSTTSHEICGATLPLPVVRYADYSTTSLGCGEDNCTVGCDEMNENCRSGIFIKSITATTGGMRVVLNASTKSQSGLGDLGLADGDVLMIDSGVACGSQCTQAMLDKVTGYRMNSGLQSVAPTDPTINYQLSNGSVVKNRLFDPSRPWSVLLRVKIDQFDWKTLCRLGDTSSVLNTTHVEFGIAGITGGKLPGSIFVRQGGGASVSTTAAGAVALNTWEHVSIVYTGSVSQRLYIYVNGQLAIYYTSVPMQTAYLPFIAGGTYQASGIRQASGAGIINLDDVRWYNTPLSAQEISLEINKGIMPPVVFAVGSSAPLGNRITSSNNETVFDMLGVSWTPAPEFLTASAGASWRRTNRGVTRAEIITPNQHRVKVCWNRDGRYADAGIVQFINPELLFDVGIHMTSTEMARYTPFVLTFRTSAPTSGAGRRYQLATTSQRLELVVLNQDSFDIAQSPHDGFELSASPKLGEIDMATGTQMVCGTLFREMWSDDPSGGFPLPEKCYYHAMRTGGNNMRKLVIVFSPRNGLRGGVSYQLVMNGVGYLNYNINRQLMMISSVDEWIPKRYDVLEYGQAFGNQGFQVGAGRNDPQFAMADGLMIVGGDPTTQTVNVPPKEATSPSFSIDVKGADFMTGKIKRDCQLRIWLWPLTEWYLPENCADKGDIWSNFRLGAFRVECQKIIGDYKKCGYIAFCAGRKVVSHGPQTPHIYFDFPSLMSDLYGVITFRLSFYGLVHPQAGLPPSRVAAEVSKKTGTKPDYKLSQGPWITAPLDSSFMLGRLLTDATNDVPFQGQPTHLLYMLLAMPVNIKGYYDWNILGPPDVRPTSTIEIKAPPGFMCLNVTQPVPGTLGQLLYSPDGDAIASLGDVSQAAPTGFGALNISGWSTGNGRTCTYTLLTEQLIPARTTMVVGVRVMPSNSSFPISNNANLWEMKVSTPGDHNLSIGMQTYQRGFYRTGAAGVPVLGQLRDVFVQPSNQSISMSGASTIQNLSVFFFTEENTTLLSSVEVEAPEHFDFESCVAQDLPDQYYVTGPQNIVHRLPGITGCSSLSKRNTYLWRHKNVARVQIQGALQAFTRYAFQVSVTNPTMQNLTNHWYGKWVVRTRDMYAVAISSTKANTPAAVAGAFPKNVPLVLRNATLAAFQSLAEATATSKPGVFVQLGSARPHNRTGNFTNATLVFRLPSDFRGKLRVAAPSGYTMSSQLPGQGGAIKLYPVASMQGLTIIPNGTSAADVSNPNPPSIDGVMLQSNVITFQGGILYGFTVPEIIAVPYFSTVTSAHSYFWEFTPDPVPFGGDAGFGLAAVVHAEAVRTISDATIRSLNTLANAHTDILFHVRTASPISYPGGLHIIFPPGYAVITDVNGSCTARPWPGQQWSSSTALASAKCMFRQFPNVGGIFMLEAGTQPLPAGMFPTLSDRLRFRVAVINPNGNKPRIGLKLMQDFSLLLGQNISSPITGWFDYGAHACVTHNQSDCWIFYSSSNASCFFNLNLRSNCTWHDIDAPQGISDGGVGTVMASAGISGFRASGRDDHLGQYSRLVFYFQLVASASSSTNLPSVLPSGKLILAGPVGFVFPTFCHHLVEIRVTSIFSTSYVAKFYWGADPWEAGVTVLSCEGTGEIATLQISAGLRPYHRYAFAIFLTNPTSVPTEKMWSVSFQNHFSIPFPSFDIWTFSNVTLTPYSRHAGPTCYTDGTCVGAGQGVPVPVNLRFRVLNTIITGGELRVTAPEDFGFHPVTPWPTNGQILRADVATNCVVYEYAGANWSSTPIQWRVKDRTCWIVDKGHPIDNSGTGDHRTFRMVLQYVFSPVDPTPPVSFQQSHGYELVMWLDPPAGYRPAIDWQFETRGVTGTLLDSGPAVGYEQALVFRAMRHSNAGLNWLKNVLSPVNVEGLSTLQDFAFEIYLPSNARNGDSIRVIAPPTFLMEFANGSCVPTVILSPSKAATPVNQTENVTCNKQTITITFRNMFGSIQTLDPVRFQFFMSNPEAPSPASGNYWRVAHISAQGGLKSAAMIASWHVIPRLADPSMTLIGTLKAAGSTSDVRLKFRTVQAAVEVIIEYKGMGLFNFAGIASVADCGGVARVPQILSASSALKLGVAMNAFENVTITITSAVLPSASGISTWNITTYRQGDNFGDPSILNDRIIFQGFFVPGRVFTPSATATTAVASQTVPISAALLGKQNAVVTLHLSISTALLPDDELHVRVEGAGYIGFELAPRSNSTINTPGLLPDAVLFNQSHVGIGYASVSNTGADISALTNCNGAPASQAVPVTTTNPIRKMVIRISQPAALSQALYIRFTLVTPPNRGILQQEKIRLEVWRKGNATAHWPCDAVLIATNDAGFVPLPVVTQLPVQPPIVPHRPPLTAILMEFILDPLDTPAHAFVITAPTDFTFLANCVGTPNAQPPTNFSNATNATNQTQSAMGADVTCSTLAATSTGRSRAKLTCKAGGVACMQSVSTFVRVLTPRVAPSASADNIWFVESVSLTTSGNVQEQLGRAELPGFQLVPMPVQIYYAAIAGIPVSIALAFNSRVSLQPGAHVHIVAANSLNDFGCGSRATGALQPLSLGSLLSCTSSRKPWSVTIQVQGALAKGNQAITIPARTPTTAFVAADNIFEVYVRDSAGNNKDVALSLPGMQLVFGLRMIVWPLWWGQISQHDTSVEVSVPMEVLDDANILVSQILIALPYDPPLKHLASGVSGVQVTSGGGSALPVQTVEIPNQNMIRIKLLPFYLAVGLYSVRFQVEVPAQRPRVDIWRVAICAAPTSGNAPDCSLTTTSQSGQGNDVITVFALPGFDATQTPGSSDLVPLAVVAQASYAGRAKPVAALVFLLLVLGCKCHEALHQRI